MHVKSFHIPLSAFIIFLLFFILCANFAVTADTTANQPSFLSRVFSFSLFSAPADSVNSGAIELIKKESCWHRPNVQGLIGQYCLGDEALNDEGRAKLTIALSNCHLTASGFDEIECSAEMSGSKCTLNVGKNQIAYSTYTTFYAHIDSLCFYMKKDHFHRSTSDAINALAYATIQSKETLEDFSNNMIANQQKLQTSLNEHIVEEDVRFKQLVSSLSNAETILQYIGIEQTRLSQQSQEIVKLSSSIQGKQYEVLLNLGLVDQRVHDLSEQQRDLFDIANTNVLTLSDVAKSGFESATAQHHQLSKQLLDKHAELTDISNQLAVELTSTKNQLSGLIHDIFYAIQNIHIELVSFTSIIFYPFAFLCIFLFTSTQRVYNCRLYLYVLLVCMFVFERILAKQQSTVVLYLTHAIMCTTQSIRTASHYCIKSVISFLLDVNSSTISTSAIPPLTDLITTTTTPAYLTSITSTIINPVTHAATASTSDATSSFFINFATECTSCHLLSQLVLYSLLYTFPTLSLEHPIIEQHYNTLTQNLPSIFLTSDQYLIMIELFRILFIIFAVSLWLYTMVTYQDHIYTIETKVSDIQHKMDQFDLSLQSFKTSVMKLIVIAQERGKFVGENVSSFSQRLSPLFFADRPSNSSTSNMSSLLNNNNDFGTVVGSPIVKHCGVQRGVALTSPLRHKTHDFIQKIHLDAQITEHGQSEIKAQGREFWWCFRTSKLDGNTLPTLPLSQDLLPKSDHKNNGDELAATNVTTSPTLECGVDDSENEKTYVPNKKRARNTTKSNADNKNENDNLPMDPSASSNRLHHPANRPSRITVSYNGETIQQGVDKSTMSKIIHNPTLNIPKLTPTSKSNTLTISISQKPCNNNIDDLDEIIDDDGDSIFIHSPSKLTPQATTRDKPRDDSKKSTKTYSQSDIHTLDNPLRRTTRSSLSNDEDHSTVTPIKSASTRQVSRTRRVV